MHVNTQHEKSTKRNVNQLFLGYLITVDEQLITFARKFQRDNPTVIFWLISIHNNLINMKYL